MYHRKVLCVKPFKNSAIKWSAWSNNNKYWDRLYLWYGPADVETHTWNIMYLKYSKFDILTACFNFSYKIRWCGRLTMSLYKNITKKHRWFPVVVEVHWWATWRSDWRNRPPFRYERVYLPLYKVADTPFHIQGDEMLSSHVTVLG